MKTEYPYRCRTRGHLIENVHQERKRGKGPSGCEACRRYNNDKYWASAKGHLTRLRAELQRAVNYRTRLG